MDVPPETPDAIPEVASTVAMVVKLLLQVPPVVACDRVVVLPAQAKAVPKMRVGNGCTVITVVTVQPVPNEYVIVAVPALKPRTTPVVAPMLAMPVLLLLHVPPPLLVRVSVAPAHTVAGPPMAEGADTTLAVAVLTHPDAKV